MTISRVRNDLGHSPPPGTARPSEIQTSESRLGEPVSRWGGAVPGCSFHWLMHSAAGVSPWEVFSQEKCSKEAEKPSQAPNQDPHMGWHFQEKSHLLSDVHYYYECHQIWWHSATTPGTGSIKIMTLNTPVAIFKLLQLMGSIGGRAQRRALTWIQYRKCAKNHLRDKHKPINLPELKEVIKKFWRTLTPKMCCRYIDHLQVMPGIIKGKILLDIELIAY